jgi:hypothetical protein
LDREGSIGAGKEKPVKRIGFLMIVFLLVAVLAVMTSPAAAGVAPPEIAELGMLNTQASASVGIPVELLSMDGLSPSTLLFLPAAVSDSADSYVAQILIAVCALGWLLYNTGRRVRRRLSLKSFGTSCFH